MATAGNGELHAFHSYDPRMAVATATTNAYLPVSLPLAEIDRQMREQHGERFNEIASFHEIPADHTHLVAGLAHEELPAIAGKLGADVVAMGAVARNRWKRLFIGATAERTLEAMPCDLLIVKPDWFEVPDAILKHHDQAA
ncbi:MAG: universal stress protein [Woeseiaceae bacterium]|nr:universal stress protein [Woeseiaceae bacterium]